MLENLVQSFVDPKVVSKNRSSFEMFPRGRNKNSILTSHKSLTERSVLTAASQSTNQSLMLQLALYFNFCSDFKTCNRREKQKVNNNSRTIALTPQLSKGKMIKRIDNHTSGFVCLSPPSAHFNNIF
uniref:Uncharacterized protein n=1 Tax=Glossina palpalis gambiensis TaxID=67801 RepID=A0A1B0AYW5_9MUSC